jgi:predicted RNA-binding protein with PUA domain
MLAAILFSLLFSRILYKTLNIKICKNLNLPVVLCRCETWSVTLSEEHKLRVFENRVLRRIFGPHREEVEGDWIRLHNEELNKLVHFTK